MVKDRLYAIALTKRKWIAEVLFQMQTNNSSCSFTKQDLTFKLAYCVSFRFILCNEPNLGLS